MANNKSFEQDLPKNQAKYTLLSPLIFLRQQQKFILIEQLLFMGI